MTKLYKEEEIEKVKEDLLKGETVAFKTDTVFGLACIYDDPIAIKKVYAAKSREEKKPLPMMCGNIDMIEQVAYVSNKTRKIMEAFMPGAITIIYKKKDVISSEITCGKDTIGIRIPNDDWILKLINMIGKPLLVTSANISNMPSLHKWEEVYEELNGKIDGIVMGEADGDLASTIVDCSSEEIKVLRQGPISEEEIRSTYE